MVIQFADRMYSVRKSFIREILKVTENSSIISFAGGLPNPKSFPVEEVATAAAKVLKECGESALQYSTTEGYPSLVYSQTVCTLWHKGRRRRNTYHDRLPARA